MGKIFSGEVEEIVLEFNRLCDRLNRTKNSSEVISCVASINRLNELYGTIVGHDIYGYKRFLRYNRKRLERIGAFKDKLLKNFSFNFIKDKNLMEEISCKVYQIIKDQFINEAMIDDIDNIVIIDKFSENELLEILCDFLMEYHPDKISLFDSMVANRRVFNIDDMCESGEVGFCIPVYKGLPFVNIRSSYFPLSVLVRIFHEFGHVVDFVDSENNFSTNSIIKYFASSFNVEITSSFNVEILSLLYEKEGIDFLIEKNINVSFSKELLRDFYEDIMINALGTYTLTQLPEDRFDNDKIYLDDSELKNILANSLFEEDYNNISVESLGLDSAIIYYIGGISSIVLNEKLHEDREHGNKIYRELSNNRTRLFLPEFLDILGYDENEVEKVIKKDFKRISDI